MAPEPTPLDRESDIMRAALDQLRRRLPNDWLVEADVPSALFGPDAEVSLTSPAGDTAILLVAAKRAGAW